MKAIDKFLRRYHTAVANKSSDIRLTMDQAAELAADINELQSKIISMKEVSLSDGPVEIAIDGGSFEV
ncbi:MAG: hypothetical protein WC284_09485 [Candidimonas sp.]